MFTVWWNGCPHQKTSLTTGSRSVPGWRCWESEQIKLTPHPEQFNRMILDAKYWDKDEPLQLDFAEALNIDNSGQ